MQVTSGEKSKRLGRHYISDSKSAVVRGGGGRDGTVGYKKQGAVAPF